MAHWDPPNKVRARAVASLRRSACRPDDAAPPLQLVITGDSSSVAATDTIVFTDAPTAGHTAIEYTAGASARVWRCMLLPLLTSVRAAQTFG